MSILINKSTKAIVQGITGDAGSFHAKQMIEYDTQIVGGVVPGRVRVGQDQPRIGGNVVHHPGVDGGDQVEPVHVPGRAVEADPGLIDIAFSYEERRSWPARPCAMRAVCDECVGTAPVVELGVPC